jgi:hypothetical protein
MGEPDNATLRQHPCAQCKKLKSAQVLLSLLPSSFAPDANATVRFARAISRLCREVCQYSL